MANVDRWILVAATLFWLTTVQAVPVLADPYTNPDHGIAFNSPAKWKAIPAPKEVDARFRSESDLVMLVRYQAPNPDQENCSIVTDVSVLNGPTEIDCAVKMYTDLQEKGDHFKIEKQELLKIAGKKAVFLQADRSGVFYENVALVPAEGKFIVVSVMSGEKWGRKKADQCKEIVRGLSFLTARQLSSMAGEKGTIQTLPSGWKLHSTPNYDVQYNTDDGFAKECGRHLEAILKEYKKRFPMELSMDENGPAPVQRRFTVKCFKQQGEFNSYAAANGVSGAAAYFSPSQNELVCYKTTDQGKKKSFHILYHEASHQYIHLYMGEEVDIPIWLNEGVAEYFFGGEFKGDRFAIDVNRERITTIKEAVRRNTFVPLAKIFQYSQSEYYANAEICYAEGWSLAYFLWHTDDPQYKGRINTFYDVLKSTKVKEQAFEKAFGDLNLDKMEQDWKQFVLKL